MEDVVVDCDVVGHAQNQNAGKNHSDASGFLALLVESATRICLDKRGAILAEYEGLGLFVAPQPIVKAFLLVLNEPGRRCDVDDSALDSATRRFIGRLPIHKKDKPHVRTAAVTTEKWLVSHDGTYDRHLDAIRNSIGVTIERSGQATSRL